MSSVHFRLYIAKLAGKQCNRAFTILLYLEYCSFICKANRAVRDADMQTSWLGIGKKGCEKIRKTNVLSQIQEAQLSFYEKKKLRQTSHILRN